MTEDTRKPEADEAGKRRGERRRTDRRRTERRTPVPAWRSPWALVSYGVLATLLVVGLTQLLGDDGAAEDEARGPHVGELREGRLPPTVTPSAAVEGPVEDARTSADFERLLAEGEAAAGRVVRVELYCDAIMPRAVREVSTVPAAVALLADSASQVPAADCKWGREGGVRRGELLLLVPPEQAERFASTRTVAEGFIRRRQVVAEIEWIGRSDALALRTAGVLRRLLPAGAS